MLIKQHGAELRELLQNDWPREALPSSEERNAALEAANVQLIAQRDAAQCEANRGRNAHRMAAVRLTKAHKATAEAKRQGAEDVACTKVLFTAGAKKSKPKRQRVKTKSVVDARKASERKSKEERMARAREWRARNLEKMKANAEREVAVNVADLTKKVAAARKRARKVEKAAKSSGKRLRRAKVAEHALKELQASLEEGPEEEAEEEEEEARTCEKSRRDARGRYREMAYQLRVIIWAQLARRVPPSAVHANISDVLQYSDETDYVPPLPCERTLQKMRGELTIASEAIAAFRVALCKRIISFGWDESTKFGLGLLSSNTQIEPHDAPGTVVDVVMRGATLTAGGTADAIAWSIDHKIFAHARKLLVGWKAEHEKQFDVGSWAAAGGPNPESIGIHRLSEQTLLMSDTCNAARACKRLIAEAAQAAGKAKIGDVAWEAMPEAQRATRCKVYIGQCHQHLRNIIINAMAIKATDSLKNLLADSLAEFSSFDRMSVDGNDLIRAVYKEFHAGGEYAKGKQREFHAWLKVHHPSTMHMHFERASGARQDIAFDGAVPIFVNRKIMLEFLQTLVAAPGHDNKLEKFLWRVLRRAIPSRPVPSHPIPPTPSQHIPPHPTPRLTGH